MIRRYSIVLLLFIILSCKSKEEKMFFDFDSVEYYSLTKSKEEEIIKNNRNGIKAVSYTHLTLPTTPYV